MDNIKRSMFTPPATLETMVEKTAQYGTLFLYEFKESYVITYFLHVVALSCILLILVWNHNQTQMKSFKNYKVITHLTQGTFIKEK